MKVAILAYHFHPDPAIGSVRAENFARWLSEAGHDVVVITRGAVDPEDLGGSFRIHRPFSLYSRVLDRLNYYRKKVRLRRALEAEGMVSNPVAGRPDTTGALTYRMPCLYDGWFWAGLRGLLRSKPDVVIATHSPYVSLAVAGAYKLLRPHVKVWLDFRDLWCGSHMTTGVPVVRIIERALEKALFRCADVVSTVSHGLARALEDSGAKRTEVIYNAPATITLLGNNGQGDLKKDTVKICYTGTIYSGWQDPSPLFSLMASPSVGAKRNVVLVFASRNPGDLLAKAKRMGVDKSIEYHGAVSRFQALQLQLSSDVLLLLESPSPDASGVLTGKVFEYLATDRPILLIGPQPGSELHELLLRHDRLMTLADLRRILDGDEVARCVPVDYRKIARDQLLTVLVSLEK